MITALSIIFIVVSFIMLLVWLAKIQSDAKKDLLNTLRKNNDISVDIFTKYFDTL